MSTRQGSRTIGRDLQAYYRLHAPLYDLTRPLFLFGRTRLVDRLAACWQQHPDAARRAPRILEIGCGTGSNLARLARRLPGAELTGIDLSPAMLARARARLGPGARLLEGAFGQVEAGRGHDLVLASYMLSMTGAQRPAIIAAARAALAPGGVLGVVDFWSTPVPAFARWMAINHVQFDPALPSLLEQGMERLECGQRAVAGLWRYGWWLGRLPGADS